MGRAVALAWHGAWIISAFRASAYAISNEFAFGK